MESFSFSSEKSYSPGMLTCARDMGERAAMVRRRPSLASSWPAFSIRLAR